MQVYGSSGSYWSSSCKHDPAIIFSLEGVEYFGADAKGVEKFNGDFVLNFTKYRNTPDGNSFSALRKYFEMPFEELQVPWPDFDIPKIKIEFWGALHKYIKKRKWKRVCFHCQGGHGRTGTALAAMLVANAGYSPLEAVEWVRESHCEESVESPSQCEYLLEIDKHYNGRDSSEESLEASVYSKITHKRSDLPGYYGEHSYSQWLSDLEDDDDKAKESEMDYELVDDDAKSNANMGSFPELEGEIEDDDFDPDDFRNK